jgi:hypothetical protein
MLSSYWSSFWWSSQPYHTLFVWNHLLLSNHLSPQLFSLDRSQRPTAYSSNSGSSARPFTEIWSKDRAHLLRLGFANCLSCSPPLCLVQWSTTYGTKEHRT